MSRVPNHVMQSLESLIEGYSSELLWKTVDDAMYAYCRAAIIYGDEFPADGQTLFFLRQLRDALQPSELSTEED